MSNYKKQAQYAINLLLSAKILMSDSGVSSIAKLECFARTFCGLAPMYESNTDIRLNLFLDLGINNIFNNELNQVMVTLPQQALVEAAYLCLGFIRSPKAWNYLDARQQKSFIFFLNEVEKLSFINNNWCLFPAMIQTFKVIFLKDRDLSKIRYALNAMENWYRGDSIYSDGDILQIDYYNSYVIHPMIFEMVSSLYPIEDFGYSIYLKRAQRYAVILENLISPEGTFPIMGRSSVYRFAAFAHLSDMARRKLLPPEINIFAVGNALDIIIEQMMANIFDIRGIIKPGLVSRTEIETEYYISEGSPYICCMGLAHLAFKEDADLWQHPEEKWTQKKIWTTDDEIILSDGIKL